MREGQTISEMRLRLLALVLALTLAWYAMNPALGPVRRVSREEEPPEGEWREAESPRRAGYGFGLVECGAAAPAAVPLMPAAEVDVDDLDWPEVIEL